MPSTQSTRSLRCLKTMTRTTGLASPLPRHFSNTALKRLRYERFGDQAGTYTTKPQVWWDMSKWNTRQRIAAAIVAVGGVYYVAHLEQVPETGRWRFMDMSPKMEARLAEESRKLLAEEFGPKILPPNHPLTRHVHRIVTRILEANHLGTLKATTPANAWLSDPFNGHSNENGPEGRQWELMVVKDDQVVNAMTSYGTIVVFTGILPVAKDEEGLASIISHEIGHSVARHNQERYSSSKILLAAATLLSVLGLDFGSSQLLSSFLLELPNSRKQELEADAIGLRLAAQACYNPSASTEMFSRMEQLDKSTRLNVNFLYTHPTSQTRIERLNKLLPDAYAIRDGNPDCSRMLEQLYGFRDAMGVVRGAANTVWGWA